ncbi:TCR/Tet family MFS transporter [Parvibaculum sp.]|uniref:TCR/Tet family MFS transporter n=1 Tax=Parvibaculum sp. TaxID=2024848 RepID=UPI0034A0158C
MERKPGKHAIVFLLIAVLIDMIGLGMIMPVMPSLLAEITGEGLGPAAAWGGWLMFTYALMQFLFAPVMGNLSDAYGRRRVLLLALGALAVDYAIMGFAPTLVWLFVGRFFAGIFGANFAVANAYIADISPPEKRAQNFGLIGAAFGIGFIIGPAVGGLLGEFGPRVPFFAAAALGLLNVIYGFFVLPETLAPENRRPFAVARANPLGAFRQMRKYPLVLGLLGAMVFFQLAHDVNPSTWSYYAMLKFGWSEAEVGASLAFVGLCMALMMGLGTRLIIPRIGETRAALLGLAMTSIGFMGFAFSSTAWHFLLLMPLSSFMGLVMPSLRAIMSAEVPPNAQGELQGALSSLVGLTMIVAPVLATQTFRAFTDVEAPVYFPGAAFVMASVFTLMSMAVVAAALKVRPRAAAVP